MRVAGFGKIASEKSLDAHMVAPLEARVTEALDGGAEEVVVRFLVMSAHHSACDQERRDWIVAAFE